MGKLTEQIIDYLTENADHPAFTPVACGVIIGVLYGTYFFVELAIWFMGDEELE